MRLSHIAEQIYHKPWLITPGGHAAIRGLFEKKMRADSGEDFSEFITPRKESKLDENGIGHVHILGVIGHRLSGIEKSCGCTDVLDIKRELMDLVDAGASGIMLNIESPGGTVTGIPELGSYITSIRAEIPVYAFGDSMIGSSAYWLAAATSSIWVSSSSQIGGIGVYLPWIDRSGLWDQVGIKADPIVNEGAPYKAAGFGPSLTEEQRAELQRGVDRLAGLFKAFVVGNRSAANCIVPDEAMMGQTFLGLDSPAYGLANEVGDESDCYDDLLAAATSIEIEF